ncbi:EAL domain-containing protein [Aquisalimonas sp.]|uniref:EAL domain-containing protein n=1 Tax=unclassified Aquisalimonas TaxID=2644645 RepID=UPI0025C07125|nr:EAL domain-containing protein [Aquisalimonas sp.]
MLNPDEVIPRLREFAEEGIALLVDDFGTGHSSLAYLKQLPVSTLKVDKMFVRRLNQDEAGAEVTRATLLLAKSFGLTTVAEGVENKETQEILRQMGCDMAQGFGIAVPMPLEELVEWLGERRV